MCHTCATQTVQHLNPGKHCSDCKWRNYPLQSPHSSPAAHTNHIILILLSPEFLGPDLCLCGSSALSSHLPVVTYISKKLFLLSSCLFLVFPPLICLFSPDRTYPHNNHFSVSSPRKAFFPPHPLSSTAEAALLFIKYHL